MIQTADSKIKSFTFPLKGNGDAQCFNFTDVLMASAKAMVFADAFYKLVQCLLRRLQYTLRVLGAAAIAPLHRPSRSVQKLDPIAVAVSCTMARCA
jgi:hypothetical protein